tara:strand:- start:94882 stop:96693 length:1812 start_codon:yes stop_codon:yes gene_type:complete
MNKTININLGGIFFHIDEEAYQKLKRYIDAIRRSLSDDPKGRDEIISDIEFRIGELLSEKVKDVRQVVSESDIEEVIVIMGQPEDYLVDEEIFNEESQRSYSGRSTRSSSNKKLFRDGDDKFIGGVASGMAYYFDVDVIWVRVAWLIATFGLGFGPLLYIILWILLPEAKTTADKLQMEGEAVNISNIEKRVRAEFESASESIKGAVDEVTGVVKEGYENVSASLKKKDLKKGSSKAQSGIQEFIDVIGKIIVTFFTIIGKFIGVILVVASTAAIIALIVSLFTAGTVDFMGAHYLFDEDFSMFNVTGAPIWLISLLMLVLIGIPFLMLFFLGLFIISSKSKILNRTTKFVLLGVWLIALLGTIYLGVKQGAEFARDGYVIERNDIALIQSDTLRIKMVDDESLSYYDNFRHRSSFRKVLDANDATRFYSNDIVLYIKKSDSSEAYIKVRKEASGSSRLAARANAEEINYDFQKLGDKLLLNGYFLTDGKNAFRNQEIKITIYIPEGQIVYLDDNTRSFLSSYINTTKKIYRGDMPDQLFRMTEDGLDCLDCSAAIWNSDDDDDDDEADGVKVDINRDSLVIEINDNGEKAAVKINKEGLKIN